MMGSWGKIESKYKKDIYLLIITRSLRSLSFGYITFLLPLYLKYIGFSVVEIGLYALAATISSSVLLLLSGFFGDIYSRKKMLLLMSVLPAIAYIILISTHSIEVAFISSVLGVSLSPMGGEGGGGPVAPLQTAMIASRSGLKERTKVYSYLNTLAIIMAILGGVMSGFIIKFFQKSYYYYLFEIAIVLVFLSAALVFPISEEPDRHLIKEKKDFLPRKSAGNIGKSAMTSMFGGLGLGIVLPLLPIYFKHIGASEFTISLIYDASYVATALGFIASSWVERFFNYVRGILIMRGAGSLPLAIIPLVHSIPFAASIYVLRTGFYQASLPLRQNVAMELYAPEERSRGASIAGLSRRLSYGIATTFGSILFQVSMYVLAFFAASFVSFLDPLLYYIFFRKIDEANKINDEVRILNTKIN